MVAVGKAHHSDCDFVLETCIVDCLTGVDEVVDIVECIEVSDCGHAVLLEHLCMELDNVPGLGVKTYDVDTS